MFKATSLTVNATYLESLFSKVRVKRVRKVNSYFLYVTYSYSREKSSEQCRIILIHISQFFRRVLRNLKVEGMEVKRRLEKTLWMQLVKAINHPLLSFLYVVRFKIGTIHTLNFKNLQILCS